MKKAFSNLEIALGKVVRDLDSLRERLAAGHDPGYGTCGRCHAGWNLVEGHTTRYGDGTQGCFPLCENCWRELTPEERVPYYQALHAEWIRQTWQYLGGDRKALARLDEAWPLIRQAVLEGK